MRRDDEPDMPPDRPGPVGLMGLRAFVAVVETGSFSRAAQQLGITQPSVSQQVRNLEQACGVRLLNRRGRSLLTQDGRSLLVRARIVLSRLQEFEDSVEELRSLRRGSLSVGFSSPPYAMRLLGRFMQAHPGIDVATRLGNTASLLAEIAECTVDVGIMTLREPNPAFSNTLVARQTLAVWVPADHPWAGKASVGVGELRQQPLVVREAGSMTRELFETACAAAGVVPVVRLVVGSREAVKEAAAAGLGLGIVLDGEAGEDRRLAAPRLAGAPAVAGVYAVCLKESLAIPAVAALLAEAAQV